MSHLLAISVGPVQEFIAAARRTRDLWFGSYLLSEISRAVAKAVENRGGRLIFPASSTAGNIANKILAEVNDPKAVADHAKREARECWEGYANQVRHELDQYPGNVIAPGIWDEQLPDVIDYFAAWVARTPNYQVDRTRVERLLAGRKNCRDFKQPGFNDAGLPKSSLDGQRPTVLVGPKSGESRETYRDNWSIDVRKKLRLSSGEQLDVVGVTKRLGKEKDEGNPRYPSVARVAAETWLRGMEKQGKLQRLKDACERLVAKGLNRVREEKYGYFPYEGTVIYKDRHPDLRKELGLGDHELDEVAAALTKIGGEPHPYLAVLVADGDKMGEAISHLDSAVAHRGFSQALAGFAREARKIVTDCHGTLIYAGGDDVIAFLPVHNCLECARDLHDKFGDLLNEYKNEKGEPPTLSVGVAIGHFMENLEDLRDYGQKAEKAAKSVPSKDALAVHVHKRGGAPIEVRGKWSEGIDSRLAAFAELINGNTIPSKLPYELRSMAKLYEPWSETDAKAAIKVDLIRLIAKKQSEGIQTVRDSMDSHLIDMTAKKLLDLSQELLVARLLATALKQSKGEAS